MKKGSSFLLITTLMFSLAVGAISALSKVGYNKGSAGKAIPVFGIDATDVAQALIK